MDVKLPQLAEGVEGGTVVNILVAEGQEVKKDQPIMELETQKAVGSIPAPSAGVVTKIHVKQGHGGQRRPSADLASKAGGAAAHCGETLSRGERTREPTPARQASSSSPQRRAAPVRAPNDYRYESKSGAPPPAPPSMRKIARELGIDLTRSPRQRGRRPNQSRRRARVHSATARNCRPGPAPGAAAQPAAASCRSRSPKRSISANGDRCGAKRCRRSGAP